MFFYMYEPNAGNVYDASWLTEWNSMFPSGTVVRIREAPKANDPCDATLPRFTGYAGTASGSGYCKRSSSLISDQPYLLVNSGWGGVVLNADMPNGNLLLKLGALAEADGSGSWQQAFAALPSATLTCTLTLTASGAVYTLKKSLSQVVVSPVRHGINLVHLIATFLQWEGLTTTTTIATPQWWLELDVWSNSVSVQLGWDELAVGAGCGVCEAATVKLSLVYGGLTASDERAFAPGQQFSGGARVLVEFGADSGKSDASLAAPLQVTASAGTVVRRSATNDVVLEVPSSFTTCGYGTVCSPLNKLSFTVGNPNAEPGVLRLQFTRK
jgi:hypothetical protein